MSRRLGRELKRLAAAVAARPRVLYALDFDGTLCEIKSRPERACLSARRRALLAGLNSGGSRLAVLSGRSPDDLKARVGVEGAYYGGSFGLDIKGPRCRFLHPAAVKRRRALSELRRRLEAALAGIRGAIVEDKGASLSVHRRGVPIRELTDMRRRLVRLRRQARGLDWREGKRAWEVAPKTSWNKGEAALFLWRRLGRPFLLAVGDDASDEALFRAARGRGVALRVGRGRSAAGLRLRDVAEAYRFLGAAAKRPAAR